MAKKARIWTPNGKSVNADEVYRKIPFFCNTYNCDAPMVIVSMGEASAHFRSKSKQDHKFPICIRNDIEFNTDKYDKNLFDLSIFKKRILSSYEKKNIHKISRKGEIIGTGSKIAPDTLKSIYAVYLNDLHSGNNVIGNCKYTDFMKCKENFADFITNPCGFYIV